MNKYQRTLPSTTVDVYDILHAYEVKSHALGHAIKKLLMAGQRGHKDYAQDLREAVQAIEREIAMSDNGSDEKRATGDSGKLDGKPEWKDAPDWAMFRTVDSDGVITWHENPPIHDGYIWFSVGKMEYDRANRETNVPDWRNTLEARPVAPNYTDGKWHEWYGGGCPVPGDFLIDYALRNGALGTWASRHLRWRHNGLDGDIVRFRVVK